MTIATNGQTPENSAQEVKPTIRELLKANLTNLDSEIEFNKLERGLDGKRKTEIYVKSAEWDNRTELECDNQKKIILTPEIRDGLKKLTERALCIRIVTDGNSLESVFRNGQIAEATIQFIRAVGGNDGGFRGWCDQNGLKRASMYRDRKMSTRFGSGIRDCIGISENKLYTCAVEGKSIDWVLENKQALIEAPNTAAVKCLWDGKADNESDQKPETRTKMFVTKRGDRWNVRIIGLTEGEATFLQRWNDSLDGNEPTPEQPPVEPPAEPLVESKALNIPSGMVIADGSTDLSSMFPDTTDLEMDIYEGFADGKIGLMGSYTGSDIPLRLIDWKRVCPKPSDQTVRMYGQIDDVVVWETRQVNGKSETYCVDFVSEQKQEPEESEKAQTPEPAQDSSVKKGRKSAATGNGKSKKKNKKNKRKSSPEPIPACFGSHGEYSNSCPDPKKCSDCSFSDSCEEATVGENKRPSPETQPSV